MLLLTMSAIAVTGIGIAIVLGVVLFLLFLLKLSFRGLPTKGNEAVKPGHAGSASPDAT